MNKKGKILPVLMLSSVAVSLLSSLARIFLTLSMFDSEYGVYARDTILPDLYHIALLAFCVLFILFAMQAAPKRAADYVTPVNDATTFCSCLCAFLLAADAIVILLDMVRSEGISLFDSLEIVFAIPAVLFFFGMVKKNAKPIPMTFASFFPIAWSALSLIRIYFDNSLLHTSPSKTFGELALLGVMVYFLSESRMLLGILNHRLYLASSLVAPILLLSTALPNLILKDRLMLADSDNTFRCAVEIAFALFIYVRLFSYSSSHCLPAQAQSVDSPAADNAETP